MSNGDERKSTIGRFSAGVETAKPAMAGALSVEVGNHSIFFYKSISVTCGLIHVRSGAPSRADPAPVENSSSEDSDYASPP